MRYRAIPIVVVSAFLGGCTAHHKPPTQGTLADLQKVAPDVKDAETKQSVDDLAKRIKARGGSLDQVPTDQPWGMRDISLTDPDGFKITIARKKR